MPRWYSAFRRIPSHLKTVFGMKPDQPIGLHIAFLTIQTIATTLAWFGWAIIALVAVALSIWIITASKSYSIVDHRGEGQPAAPRFGPRLRRIASVVMCACILLTSWGAYDRWTSPDKLHFLQIDIHNRLDDLEQLVDDLDSYVRHSLYFNLDPDNPSADAEARVAAALVLRYAANKWIKARAATLLGDWHLADRYITAAEQISPHDPHVVTARADYLYYQGRFEGAISKYETAIRSIANDFGIRNNLAIAYQQSYSGNRLANLQRAIEIHNGTLAMYPKDSLQWAITAGHKALALRDLPVGDRQANIKEAELLIEDALAYLKRTGLAVELAELKVKQASVLKAARSRVNILRAVDLYEEALVTLTRERDEVVWARIHHNLGLAHSMLLLRGEASHFDDATKHFELALNVRTEKNRKVEWAATQLELGRLWTYQPNGDRLESFKVAREYLTRGIEALDEKSNPYQFAMGHRYLADLLREMGDPVGLVNAVTHYQIARTILRDINAAAHLECLDQLGRTWWTLGANKDPAMIRKGIACFDEIEQLYGNSYGDECAVANVNRGSAWLEVSSLEGTVHFEEAMVPLRRATTTLTRDRMPDAWMGAQHMVAQAVADWQEWIIENHDNPCQVLTEGIAAAKAGASASDISGWLASRCGEFHLPKLKGAFVAANCGDESDVLSIPAAP